MRSTSTFSQHQAQPLTQHALRRFTRLCEAAAFTGGGAVRAHAIFKSIVLPAIASTPSGWISDISDEQMPIEFSVALRGNDAEVRVLFEAQGASNSLAAYRKAALALTHQLPNTLGADLTKFKEVVDLFLPMRMAGPFALWHSLVFKQNRVDAKVYFNAQARGLGAAHATVEEALHRLGMSAAWPALMRSSLRRGPKLDEIKYLALDLSADREARVKVYVRHHAASPSDLETACSASREYVPGEATDFASSMSGGAETLRSRAPFTCSAFSGADHERPSATTLYVPVCAYARDDAAVTSRVSEHLRLRGLPARAYERLITGYADRDLEIGIGMQSWLALRRLDNEARLTVYLSSEARGSLPPGSVPAPTEDRTAYTTPREVMMDLRRYSLSGHPVIRLLRIQRRSPSAARDLEVLSSLCRAIPNSSELSVHESAARFEQNIRGLTASNVELQRWSRRSPELHHAVLTLAHGWSEIRRADDPQTTKGAIVAAQTAAEQLLSALGPCRVRRATPSAGTLGLLAIDAGATPRLADALEAQSFEPSSGGDTERFAAGANAMHNAFWGLLNAVYTYLGQYSPNGNETLDRMA
jgi:DMATS type aromatic prenyltransferase